MPGLFFFFFIFTLVVNEIPQYIFIIIIQKKITLMGPEI